MTTTGVPGEPDLGRRQRRLSISDIGDSTAPAMIRRATREACEAARQAIKDGECIVLPTDTVYGIGVDAFSAEAVQRLLDAKNRGRDMPPPVLIGEPALIRTLAADARNSQCFVEALAGCTHSDLPDPAQPADLGDTEGRSHFVCQTTSWHATSCGELVRWR